MSEAEETTRLAPPKRSVSEVSNSCSFVGRRRCALSYCPTHHMIAFLVLAFSTVYSTLDYLFPVSQ